MKIYHSYVAALTRKRNGFVILSASWALAPGAVSDDVVATADRILGEGAALAAVQYSHILVIVDNVERRAVELPDPIVVAQEAMRQRLARARAELLQAEATRDTALVAAARAAEAQIQVTAAAASIAELEAALGIVSSEIDKGSSGAPAGAATAPVGASPDFTEFTDGELLDYAIAKGIDLGSATDRNEIIGLFLASEEAAITASLANPPSVAGTNAPKGDPPADAEPEPLESL